MVRLSEGDARAAASNGAGINRSEALEETGGPLARPGWASDGRWISARRRGTIHPVVEVGFPVGRHRGGWEIDVD